MVLDKCLAERCNGVDIPLTDDRRAEWRRRNHAMAERALRVLALAYHRQ